MPNTLPPDVKKALKVLADSYVISMVDNHDATIEAAEARVAMWESDITTHLEAQAEEIAVLRENATCPVYGSEDTCSIAEEVKRLRQVLTAARMFLRNVYADNGAKDEEEYLKAVISTYLKEQSRE